MKGYRITNGKAEINLEDLEALYELIEKQRKTISLLDETKGFSEVAAFEAVSYDTYRGQYLCINNNARELVKAITHKKEQELKEKLKKMSIAEFRKYRRS